MQYKITKLVLLVAPGAFTILSVGCFTGVNSSQNLFYFYRCLYQDLIKKIIRRCKPPKTKKSPASFNNLTF